MNTIKRLLLAFGLVLSAFSIRAQTQVTAPMTGTPAAGSYFSYSSITISPPFSFAAGTGSSLKLYIQSLDCQSLATAFSAGQNYVLTSIPRVAMTMFNPTGRTTCELMQTVQYIDGLGRPLQTVQVKGSPQGRDIVQPFAYDQFGRETQKYLPYVATAASSDGSYKSTALADQSSFYANPSGTTWTAPGVVTIPAVSGTLPTAATTVFEPSPLNRVIEQGATGAAWQPVAGSTAGHTNKVVYSTNNILSLSDTANSTMAALYTVTINANQSRTLTRGTGTNANYGAGQLYVTISKDENNKGARGGTTEEYKDKEGHVVLKRTFNYTGSTREILSTYYVYDDLGNLSYVLPPISGADALLPSAALLNSVCYQYRYDERNRLTQKKIPGKGWEFVVYNQLDQPVLSQDSLQRVNNQWLVTKYDALGRVILTGLWNAGSVIPLATLQASIYGGVQWDTRNYTEPNTGYSLNSYPAVSKMLSVSYYDGYTGIPGIPSSFLVTGNSVMTKGLLTAMRTAVLNTITAASPDYLWTAHYYDDLGRSTKSFQQHYLGGTVNAGNYDVDSTTFDFSNEATTTTRQHFTSASTSTPKVIISNQYSYDHMGRKLKTWEQLQNGGQTADNKVLVSRTDYNELGQVMTKHLHSTDSTTFRQDVSYTYNERGWLLTSSAPLFQEELQYNTTVARNSVPVTPQYNGNIAMQSWGTSGTPNSKTTRYIYDQLNRLTLANSTTGNHENGITYDVMGNITALNRYTAYTLTDQLSYNYPVNSARLHAVTDATTSDVGQKHGTATYGYDGNGNLTSDDSKGISMISYNMLNLPQAITGKSTTYTYAASGQKLRRVIGTAITDYVSGIQYDGTTTTTSTISFIQTEEGRALPNGTTAYNYEYSLTDHLGNSRVNFDSSGPTATAKQTDDYYAFGMDIPTGSRPSVVNDYLYNRKELQENLGLYDYGARFYDPVIARWTSVDPLAEMERRASPYNYTFDDPIRHNDPDGMFGEDVNDDANCCGTPTTATKVTAGGILGGGLAAAGTIAVGGLATGPGEMIALPTAGVVVLGTLAGAGGAWLLDKIFGGDNTRITNSVPRIAPTIVQGRKPAAPGSRPGKIFTPRGKKTVIDQNKTKNNGKTICEHCGVETTKPEKSQKGVTPPTTDTHVDHIDAQANGGSGTEENGQVLCGACNIKKSDKPNTPPQQPTPPAQ